MSPSQSALEALPSFGGIDAVIFDMDGTLIDSESFSDRAILGVLAESGIEAHGLDCFQFHGVAWQRIAPRLCALYPDLPAAGLQKRISDGFNRLLASEKPPFLPGAQAAFRAAAASLPVAIATGSDAAAVEDTIERGGLRAYCRGYRACEDYQRSKPHPEPYIRTAALLDTAPSRCLVFEDSHPGLEAAKNAGMRTIGIAAPAGPSLPTALADAQIEDYHALPAGFFDALASA